MDAQVVGCFVDSALSVLRTDLPAPTGRSTRFAGLADGSKLGDCPNAPPLPMKPIQLFDPASSTFTYVLWDAATREALRRAAAENDLIVTSGGVSVGDFDVVKKVLAAEGEITFWRVRMKPGKPLAFGVLRGKEGRNIPLFGLAGNPVSAMINFELFARPAILKMMGRKSLTKPVVEAIVEDAIENTDGRRVFARAIVEKHGGRYFARLTGPQGSGILTSMALANGLVVIPEDTPGVKRGDLVRVMMLDWGEEIDI